MSKPKADGVKHIFDELGEQPAQRRTKDITMNETTSDADIFPPDRPRPELRAVSGEKIGLLPKGLPFKTLADLAVERTIQKQWLIKGLFARGETSAWVGPPGSMKSSLLCSAAVHASSPQVTDWFGYRCKEKTASLYFALERSDLVRRRLIAECETLKIDFPPIAVIQKQFTLARPEEYRLLVDTIKAAEDRFGMEVGFATFDTLAKLIAAGGGDENSARDCNIVFANIAALKDETNVHVAFAAHTGKDVSRGTRGSNAQPGDFDLEVTISGDIVRTAIANKRNDGPEGPLFSFGSALYDFGTDEDGDPITVNIVSDDQISTSQTESLKREAKLKPNQQTVFAMLHAAGRAGLTLEDWNNQAKDAGIGLKRKADLTDIRNALLSRQIIRTYGDRWYVVRE